MPALAIQGIVVRAAVDFVVPRAAVNCIVAPLAIKRVVIEVILRTRRVINDVITVTTVDKITVGAGRTTPPVINGVIARATVDVVRPIACGDGVIAVTRNDLVVIPATGMVLCQIGIIGGGGHRRKVGVGSNL